LNGVSGGRRGPIRVFAFDSRTASPRRTARPALLGQPRAGPLRDALPADGPAGEAVPCSLCLRGAHPCCAGRPPAAATL